MSNVTLKNATVTMLNGSDSAMSELHPSLAVNALQAMPGMSEAYRFISTKALGESIEAMGYQLHTVSHAKVLKQEKNGYQKHLLRFRLPEHMVDNVQLKAKGEFPEIVVINSHDGNSSTRLMAGFFRLVCANGLISGSISDEIRIRHVNSARIDPEKQLAESLEIVAAKAKNLLAVSDKWKQVYLTPAAIERLANVTIDARLKDTDFEHKEIAFNLSKLLSPRRNEDTGTDLWKVFNVLQENAIKSPLLIRDVLENKDSTLRAPRSIDKLVRINKTLWTAAEELAA